MFWSITPLVTAVFIYKIFPKKAQYLLTALVIFNLVSLSLQYLPRLKNSRTITYPPGPGYLTQTKLVKEICGKEKKLTIGLPFSFPARMYLSHSLTGMIAIIDKPCRERITFSYDIDNADYLIYADATLKPQTGN